MRIDGKDLQFLPSMRMILHEFVLVELTKLGYCISLVSNTVLF